MALWPIARKSRAPIAGRTARRFPARRPCGPGPPRPRRPPPRPSCPSPRQKPARARSACGKADSLTGVRAQRVLPKLVGLRGFEVIESPKDRQPALGVGRSQAGQVGRVDHQHRMELEAHRAAARYCARPPAAAPPAARDTTGRDGCGRRSLRAAFRAACLRSLAPAARYRRKTARGSDRAGLRRPKPAAASPETQSFKAVRLAAVAAIKRRRLV